jgi:hypothetical protein
MMFKILRHMEIAGKYEHIGSVFQCSVLDSIMENTGDLLYHYSETRYQRIHTKDYAIIFNSEKEMNDYNEKKIKK